MFLHLSVSHSVHGGSKECTSALVTHPVVTPPRSNPPRHTPLDTHTHPGHPPWTHPRHPQDSPPDSPIPYGQQADVMHLTGILSCFILGVDYRPGRISCILLSGRMLFPAQCAHERNKPRHSADTSTSNGAAHSTQT